MVGFTRPDRKDFVPAYVATGVWLSVGAGLDAYLLTRHAQKPLITDVLRTKTGSLVLAILCLHVVNVLGKADPFRATAAVITKKQAARLAALTDALTGE